MPTPNEPTPAESSPSTEPEIVALTPMTVALFRQTVPMNALTDYFDRAFRTVGAVLGAQQIPITGPPLGVYYGMPTDTVDVAAGFPTGRLAEAADGVTAEALTEGRAAQILHVGGFDAMQETYRRLTAWMTQQGLVPGPVMWETYLTEPKPGGEQESLQTLITWPLAG